MKQAAVASNLGAFVFGRFSIVVLVALLIGYIFHLERSLSLLKVSELATSSGPAVHNVDNKDIAAKEVSNNKLTDDNGKQSEPLSSSVEDQQRKWQLLTDRSTLPDRITLRGAHKRCKGDVKCIENQKVHDTYELMYSPPEHTCHYFRLIGKGDAPGIGGQGPYHVCFDTPFRPVYTNCLVYSFGIADDWSFDDTMAGQMGCNVLSFDPTIGLKEHNRSANHHFFPWGISSHDHTLEDKGLLMKSLSSIHKLLLLENKMIDILKIDAESWEVASFQQLITDGFLQKYVKQILIEWHPGWYGVAEPTLTAYYRLHHEAGFKAFYTEPRYHDGLLYLVESLVNTKYNNLI